MKTVKFIYPYSGSVAKFKELKHGDTLEVTDTEYNILLNLGVIEGSKSLQQKEEDAQRAINNKEEKIILKTKEEKHSNTTK